MKITKMHLDFWQSKQRLPGWGMKFLSTRRDWFPWIKSKPSLVHRLIPVENPMDKNFHIQNLMNLLKSARHRTGSVVEMLKRLSISQHEGKQEKRLCRKWLLRINSIT